MIQEYKTRPPKVDDPFIILPFLLKQTSDTIINAIELELAHHNISIPQARILFFWPRKTGP